MECIVASAMMDHRASTYLLDIGLGVGSAGLTLAGVGVSWADPCRCWGQLGQPLPVFGSAGLTLAGVWVSWADPCRCLSQLG